MYDKLGYTVFRRVLRYYGGADSEDAFDMRKALGRSDGSHVIPLKRPINPSELWPGN